MSCMFQETNTEVILNIGGKNFKIICPQDKCDELQQAAAYLDNRISLAQQKDEFASLVNLAIIVALNISHELLLEKKREHKIEKLANNYDDQLKNLAQKISEALEIEK